MIIKFNNILPDIHETCYIAENSAVIGDVKIGKDSSVWFGASIRGDVDKIIIGENSNIQDGASLHCTEKIVLSVGNNVTIGHGAILHSCKVGNNSLIGMGAILLDNVVVGENCMIAAGSVLTPNTKIADGSLVMGSPAKIKRELTNEEIQSMKNNAISYVELKETYKSIV